MSNHQARYSIGKCDFAFTFDFSDDSRHYRLPLWVLQIDWFNKGGYGNPKFILPLSAIENNEFISHPKNKFCAFIFSNPTPKRVETYQLFSSYKQVDGYGKPFNNWSYGESVKYNILKNYRFSICFENRRRSGYYTEKPFHAKTSGTIPIYYSDELVSHDFNDRAFLNLNDFDSLEQLLERVKEVDQDEELYKNYFGEPLFKGGKIKEEFQPPSVLNFLTILF